MRIDGKQLRGKADDRRNPDKQITNVATTQSVAQHGVSCHLV